MTVIEIIKKFGLEDFSLRYKNLYGQSRDVSYPLDELVTTKVKAVNVNFPTKEAEITLLRFD